MPLRIGDTFAGYRILRLLGSGGMGEVYLVQHPRLPRQDALKVLRHDLSSDTSFRERFIREADLAAGLRHPHIVGIHDRGDYNGQLWIAMDYIDGTDAAQLIQQRYPAGMPADLAIPIVTAVASALDYAHKKGLLHRDVKPANIIVADLDSDDRSVFLADFGIARSLDDISGITTTNMTVGTVAYAAPEQLMGEAIDGRADEYALAATAYHLLTGMQLFPHTNPAVVISRHLNSPPPAVADTRPDLRALDPIFTAALAKDPDDRFALCGDFATALAEPLSAQSLLSPVAATRPAVRSPGSKAGFPGVAITERPPQTASAAPDHSRRRWLVPTAALATAFLAIAALAWHPWERSRSTSATPTTFASSPPATSSSFSVPPPPPLSTSVVTPSTTVSPSPTALSPNSLSGPCSQPGMVSESAGNSSYSLCTSVGWVYVDAPLISSGGCAHVGTVAPSSAPYTVCTQFGWVDVNRPVCADFGDYFKSPAASSVNRHRGISPETSVGSIRPACLENDLFQDRVQFHSGVIDFMLCAGRAARKVLTGGSPKKNRHAIG